MQEPSTHDRLLAAARDLFLEVGPVAFSLREVARRTELTAAAVYRHFDGKEALLAAVCEEGFRAFGSYLMAALKAKSARARLMATGDQYLRFALERPRDYRVIFMSEVPAGTKMDPDSLPPTFAFLVDRVRECIDSGDLRAGEPMEMAVTIWAHVHGLASLRISGHFQNVGDDDAFRKIYTRSVDVLLEGLSL
jgi:AcrR family transcriptional regulator